jgi:multidrug efflux pump subunit AcrA (membrane-fusion protein)
VLQQLQNITYNKPDLEEDIKENADYAILELSGLLTITDIFINAVNDNQNKDIYTGLEKTTINTELNIARNNLISTIDNIRRGLSTLNTSKESLDKANINATGQTVSASDAQLKQAFGVLESARSALNKTIIKTPVSGTITAASISVGDIINIGNDVVFVTGDTNTAAVENSVTVPLTAVKFTPTKAYIFSVAEGKLIAHEVKTGLVTSNSITISEFGDVTQIVTDVRGLKAGDAVLVQ